MDLTLEELELRDGGWVRLERDESGVRISIADDDMLLTADDVQELVERLLEMIR